VLGWEIFINCTPHSFCSPIIYQLCYALCALCETSVSLYLMYLIIQVDNAVGNVPTFDE
jgi:hypothetical protein